MKTMSLLQKCILALGFAASVTLAGTASAAGLTNVSMTPTLATDPGFNNPGTPTINLGQMDSSTVLNFTFTNTSSLNAGTLVYPKITIGNGVVGYTAVMASSSSQQLEVSTTVGALMQAMGCAANAPCSGSMMIGWGIATDQSFTDSMLINFQYRE